MACNMTLKLDLSSSKVLVAQLTLLIRTDISHEDPPNVLKIVVQLASDML